MFLQHFVSDFLLVVHSSVDDERSTIREFHELRNPLRHDVLRNDYQRMVELVNGDGDHRQNRLTETGIKTQKSTGSSMR
ncbi:hypothetical protein NY2A_b740R [Paramecium bursaria Chlorella virus NY2A]|uniref:Uncharacterized protein b740R n=1 Tax=Paramecium bursaria Chlorella virus NY2A TaxID=46021 RepID=A7IXR5_PBCVN|nr:hypothetical protein NY2A_b740R [Paramecium bursaria Chlorella virus NY2A]ABT15139.1 hypothetical protein NY2A_b740R [Paramecium bursaria Chlorella virus NY2A]